MQVLLNAFLWEFSMHILFIDDNAVFANALSEMLEEQNIQVDQAECGGSGHELADIYDYQAIVLDFACRI